MESDLINTAKRKGRKVKRWFLKIVYIFFGVYFIADFVLYFVATPLLKTYLQDKVSKETNGLFSIDFESISIELASRRVALKNFELIPDSVVYTNLAKQKKNIPALYKISCNSVELWRMSFYKLIFRGKLKAKELKLIDLNIELKQLPNSSSGNTNSRDFVHDDLFPSISDYFSEIRIEEIMVVNGKFNLDLSKKESKKTTHIGYVSVNLFNFLLNEDEYKKKNRLFFSDNIELNIDEYRITLSDKIHFIYAQDLNISTSNSRLTAKNAGISTINKDKRSNDLTQNNHYNINAPYIEIDHFKLYDLYFKNDINIGKVNVKKPRIDIFNVVKTGNDRNSSVSKTKEINLSKLIESKLNSVNIDTFKIDAGSLNFFFINQGQKPAYRANSLSLALYNFKLSDYSLNDQSKLFYSDNVELNVKGFSTVMPDKIHTMNVSDITLSSFDNSFRAEEIKIKPLDNSLSTKALMNIEIPYLDISGTDFNKLYHQRVFNISTLTIGNSKFDLNFRNTLKENKDKGAARNFLSTVTSTFLNHLSIRNINLKESNFKIKNQINDSVVLHYGGEVAFSLINFNLDRSQPDNRSDQLFYSDHFNLKLKNYSQNLYDHVHQLVAKSIEISTADSLIEITGLKIMQNDKPVNQLNSVISKWIYNFDLIQVSMKGIDINKAYNDSLLVGRSISILHPSFKIINNIDVDKPVKKAKNQTPPNNLSKLDSTVSPKHDESSVKKLLGAYFKQINLDGVTLEDADLSLIDIDSAGNQDPFLKAKISTKLNEFRLIPEDSVNDQILYSENISFKITDFFSKIFDKKYQLKIKQARFSSRDSAFSANLVRIFPVPEYENLPGTNNSWSFYSPEINATKTDIAELINSNILNLGYLNVTSPSLANSQRTNIQEVKNPNAKKERKKIFPFNKIKLLGINVHDGVFGVLKNNFNYENLSLNSKIDIQTQAIEIDSNTFSNPSAFISGLDATASFDDISYFLKDSLHLIKIKHLGINTHDKTINGDSLHYFPLYKIVNFQEKRGINEFQIPSFTSSGFRFDKLIFNKSIVADSFSFKSGVFDIFGKEKALRKKGFNISNIDLYSKIENKLNCIEINKILFENSKLLIAPAKEPIRRPKTFDKIYIDISNLIVDSTNRNKNKILNADDINIRIKDYRHNFANNLYSLFFKELGISTGQNMLFASGINLNPNKDRIEYGDSTQKEVNFSYLKSDGLTAKGIDLKDFLSKGNIVANQVDIDQVQYHSYKSKHYPMDSIVKSSLPLDYILKSDRFIKIDTLNIHNSYISHEILTQDASENGFIDFTNINGNVYNLTNSKEAIEKKENTTVVASGYLMDKSLITASFHFPLDSKSGEYYYGGELDTFDLKEINPMLENSSFAMVSNGTLNNLKFNIIANDDYAEGNLTMTYKNLKIELLDKRKTDSLQVEKRGLSSMLANSIIRSSNPKNRTGFIHDGEVYFERNIYRSVFNYWAFSILSGVKSTLGLKSKQLKERNKLEKLTEKTIKKNNKKTAKRDKKKEKIQRKLIEKEIKQEQRMRKKTQRKTKKSLKAKISSSLIIPIRKDDYFYADFKISVDGV